MRSRMYSKSLKFSTQQPIRKQEAGHCTTRLSRHLQARFRRLHLEKLLEACPGWGVELDADDGERCK